VEDFGVGQTDSSKLLNDIICRLSRSRLNSCLPRSCLPCLGVVFLARDGLGRGRDNDSEERGPRLGRGFSQVCTLSKSRFGRSGLMVIVKRGLGRSAVYVLLTLGNGSDGGFEVKRVLRA
jgi:hypothetical protein